jgi:hypothetical protein
MPLNAEQRTARARLAAVRRHHGPDADLPSDAAEIEQAALDRHIDELIASWPRMTAEQAARLRPLVNPPAKRGATG